jgi:hypothetical protein
VKGFFDPSVQFGLQFEEIGEPETQVSGEESKEPKAAQTNPPVPVPSAVVPEKDTSTPAAGAEVVRLDRFRKK